MEQAVGTGVLCVRQWPLRRMATFPHGVVRLRRRLVAGVLSLFPLATTASWGLVQGSARRWSLLACLRVTAANLPVPDSDPDCS